MTARPIDYIEGLDVNTSHVAAMVLAIDDATAVMEASPLAHMKTAGTEETPALRDYRASLLRHATADLAASLRGALVRFERVAARKLAALGGAK